MDLPHCAPFVIPFVGSGNDAPPAAPAPSKADIGGVERVAFVLENLMLGSWIQTHHVLERHCGDAVRHPPDGNWPPRGRQDGTLSGEQKKPGGTHRVLMLLLLLSVVKNVLLCQQGDKREIFVWEFDTIPG